MEGSKFLVEVVSMVIYQWCDFLGRNVGSFEVGVRSIRRFLTSSHVSWVKKSPFASMKINDKTRLTADNLK